MGARANTLEMFSSLSHSHSHFLTREEFLNDETLKRAVTRSLEIIGEATKKIPADFKIKWNNVKWKEMAGMRDRLIHDYIGVNYSIVWDVIINKIPELCTQVVKVIDNVDKTDH